MVVASELDAERVARILLTRGSVREAVALLRGAVARDREEETCAALLAEVLAGQIPQKTIDGPALSLSLVDRWIRKGMLVEALALLGGTPMGSEDTGREWANLLGELLAPVPVDAEETLVNMHRELLTGGASVALTLLEERSRREPALPAWAVRRRDLLRWMLLDNAPVAESHQEMAGEAPSALAAAIRDPVNRRDIPQALEAARAFARAHPEDPDAPRVVEALQTTKLEIEKRAEEVGSQSRTLPMFGHPAAAMQLRMGNLTQACVVYNKLLAKDPNDTHARYMLAQVDVISRAMRGEPVVDDWAFRETTNRDAVEELDIPSTAVTAIPEAPEKSGPVRVRDAPDSKSAEADAERLLLEGRLDEAEALYRLMGHSQPENPKWVQRADAIRASRSGETDAVVLVRVIRTIE